MRTMKTRMRLHAGLPHPSRLARIAGAILAAASLSGAPISAQEGETAPLPEAAPEEAPAAKPRPKQRPRTAAPKPKPPEDAKPADPKPAEGKPVEGKSAESKSSEDRPAVERTVLERTVLEPAASDAPATWPNGARSVSEGYGDWMMNCAREGTRTDCVVIQSQGDRKTGKRQFSLELRAPKDGRAEGLILMPFGMQIEPGVTFKLDDRALGKGAPYSHCVADGCLVPISLPNLATDTMKTAQSLTVTATRPDAKEPTVITVPLSGFAAAFARAVALGG